MTPPNTRFKRTETAALIAVLLLFAGQSLIGITWGLPSREIDRYLFGDESPWPGEKIHRLSGAAEKFSPQRGADVDADPLGSTHEPIALTDTDEDVAGILLRYRLYTYQPDEMITMMALAGMNPRELQLDPRLYQYGGLFLYPVGALVAAAGMVGLIDVRSDVVYYLDHPEEFGKFYVVARAYAAAWGMIGVIVVFAIARRLRGSRAGLLAALLFALMPVVVCMAHEGKPHLPGAVLMLLAVLFAMRHLSFRAAGFSPRGDNSDDPAQPQAEHPRGLKPAARDRDFNWWLMCLFCGAALGMVLSSWPIFVLIPLVALRETPSWSARLKRTAAGAAVATVVYLVTNPYVLINAFANREVLRSNFGNSLAMYDVSRIMEGFVRVLELTVEGATLPILLLGVLALIVAGAAKGGAMIPLAVSAGVFFLQFVLIGAGKPAEYGRFGIFTNTALAIGTACLLVRPWTRLREIVNWVPAAFVTLYVMFSGAAYLRNFHVDTTEACSRMRLAQHYASNDRDTFGHARAIAVLAEPAPYSLPPVNFARRKIRLYPSPARFAESVNAETSDLVRPNDRCIPPTVPATLRPTENPDRPRRDPYVWPPPHPSTWLERLGSLLSRDTPISWANKPFAVSSLGWTWTVNEGRPIP